MKRTFHYMSRNIVLAGKTTQLLTSRLHPCRLHLYFGSLFFCCFSLAFRHVLGFWLGWLLESVLACRSLGVSSQRMLRFPEGKKAGTSSPHTCCLGSLVPPFSSLGKPFRHPFVTMLARGRSCEEGNRIKSAYLKSQVYTSQVSPIFLHSLLAERLYMMQLQFVRGKIHIQFVYHHWCPLFPHG